MNKTHKAKCEEIYVQAIMILAEDGGTESVFFLLKDGHAYLLDGLDIFAIGTDEAVDMAIKIAIEKDSEAMVFVSEGYQSKNMEYVNKPKEDPEARQVLNLLYITADGKENEIITGDIKKTLGGVSYIEDWEWMDGIKQVPLLKGWK